MSLDSLYCILTAIADRTANSTLDLVTAFPGLHHRSCLLVLGGKSDDDDDDDDDEALQH